MEQYVLEVRNIVKQFPGVTALNDVSIGFRGGEVHALLGENGAGKSTLIKIISGVYTQTSGEVYLEGQKLENLNVKKCKAIGIAAIQQELNLVPELTIAENVFLGSEKTKLFGWLSTKQMEKETKQMLDRFRIDLDPSAKVSSLSISQQQIVEIIKAMKIDSKVFILDEPTDVLTEKETVVLFEIIRELRRQGKAIIYISHRLDELPLICDTFSVLRDGCYRGSGSIADCSKNDIISLMIGRNLSEQFIYHKHPVGEVVMELQACQRKDFGKPVDMSVRAGEVLGLYGLVGSGRTEIMRAAIGAERLQSGRVVVGGKQISRPISVAKAHKAGVFYSTEDRKKTEPLPALQSTSILPCPLFRRFMVLQNCSVQKRKQLSAKTSRTNYPSKPQV